GVLQWHLERVVRQRYRAIHTPATPIDLLKRLLLRRRNISTDLLDQKNAILPQTPKSDFLFLQGSSSDKVVMEKIDDGETDQEELRETQVRFRMRAEEALGGTGPRRGAQSQ